MTVSQEHVSRETIILNLFRARSCLLLDCILSVFMDVYCGAGCVLDPFLVSCVEQVSVHVTQFLNSQGVGEEVGS